MLWSQWYSGIYFNKYTECMYAYIYIYIIYMCVMLYTKYMYNMEFILTNKYLKYMVELLHFRNKENIRNIFQRSETIYSRYLIRK